MPTIPTPFLPRDASERLEAWMKNPRRKPLLVTGARQVGKTALVMEFGRQHFENIAYLRLDTLVEAEQIFADFDIDRIIRAIQALTGVPVNPGKTLLFIDEIQEFPRAITALKYFCEELRELHVVASGSYLGLSIHEGTGFPVGKVNRLRIEPMSFHEFLTANGQGALRSALEEADTALFPSLEERLTEWLSYYFIVGGMPEIVAEYVDSGLLTAVRESQLNLMRDYRDSLSKHVPEAELSQVLQIWDQAASHLAREGRRLVFSELTQGARARSHSSALHWLGNAGLLRLVTKVKAPGIPLGAYAEHSFVKPYALDIGLLGAQLNIDPVTLIQPGKLFTQFKGLMCEQYVVQTLSALTASGSLGSSEETPYYFSESRPQMEVDGIVASKGKCFAIEVKSSANIRSESLRRFHEKYPDVECRRFSPRPYRRQDWMANVPLYAVGVHRLWE